MAALPELLGPSSLTILATYKCSAQCRECCFESSPHLTQRLSLEQIKLRIRKAREAFPLLRLVCFSGGECFLLGKDLDEAIALATSLRLLTRCVSNGYWAADMTRARERVASLRIAGLKELNLSTGDEHQEYVPFDTVVNAAIAAASGGIKVLIVNEGSREAKFTKMQMLTNPRIESFLRDDSSACNLSFMENVWMSFHEDHDVFQEKQIYDMAQGCSNILTNFVATPDGQMASCCGLTLEHIPEMKIGDGDTDDFIDMCNRQLDDFLKLWIAVEGPKRILQFAASKNPAVSVPKKASHICEACVQMYQSSEVKETLIKHYEEMVAEVVTRFHLSRTITRSPELNRIRAENDLVMLGA